jgi:hypothetical protein
MIATPAEVRVSIGAGMEGRTDPIESVRDFSRRIEIHLGSRWLVRGVFGFR